MLKAYDIDSNYCYDGKIYLKEIKKAQLFYLIIGLILFITFIVFFVIYFSKLIKEQREKIYHLHQIGGFKLHLYLSTLINDARSVLFILSLSICLEYLIAYLNLLYIKLNTSNICSIPVMPIIYPIIGALIILILCLLVNLIYILLVLKKVNIVNKK